MSGSRVCSYGCGAADHDAALEPYGPNGAPVCFLCALHPAHFDDVTRRMDALDLDCLGSGFAEYGQRGAFHARPRVRCPSCNSVTVHDGDVFACDSAGCARRGQIVARVVFVSPAPAAQSTEKGRAA